MLTYTPEQLLEKFQERTVLADQLILEKIIERVNTKLSEYVQNNHPGVGKSLSNIIYITSQGQETKEHIQNAVDTLVNYGYNASYDYTPAYDDGPNRSSSESFAIKIDISKPLIPKGQIKR